MISNKNLALLVRQVALHANVSLPARTSVLYIICNCNKVKQNDSELNQNQFWGFSFVFFWAFSF